MAIPNRMSECAGERMYLNRVSTAQRHVVAVSGHIVELDGNVRLWVDDPSGILPGDNIEIALHGIYSRYDDLEWRTPEPWYTIWTTSAPQEIHGVFRGVS
jgi:hypothetical protein